LSEKDGIFFINSKRQDLFWRIGVDSLEIRSKYAHLILGYKNADFAHMDIEYVREKLYFLISVAPDT